MEVEPIHPMEGRIEQVAERQGQGEPLVPQFSPSEEKERNGPAGYEDSLKEEENPRIFPEEVEQRNRIKYWIEMVA